MSTNQLHTDACLINSLNAECDCTCTLTLEGKYGRVVAEKAVLERQLIALYNKYVGCAQDASEFVDCMAAAKAPTNETSSKDVGIGDKNGR